MVETKTRTEEERKEEVLRTAYRLYCQSPKPDWVAFYREILGPRGVARRMYPSTKALKEFEQTETYAEILRMLTRLRERPFGSEDVQEPTRVVTVRLPRSVHEAIRLEAYEHRTSMNQLCISKLLQFIEKELIPRDPWQSRTASEEEGDEKKGDEEKGPGADL